MITNEEDRDALAPWLLGFAVAAGAAGVRNRPAAAGPPRKTALRGCARAVFRGGPAAAGRFLLAVVGALGGPGRRGTSSIGRSGRVTPAAAGQLRSARRAPAAVPGARASRLSSCGRASPYRARDGLGDLVLQRPAG